VTGTTARVTWQCGCGSCQNSFHCRLVACHPSRWTRRRRWAGSEGNVKAGFDPLVKILVIYCDQSAVEKHLAFPVGICLACHQTPLPDLLAVRTRFSTLLDKVVNRGQYFVWCDRRTLIRRRSTSIFGMATRFGTLSSAGTPSPTVGVQRLPLFASMLWNSLNLSKSMTALPVCQS